MAETRTVLMENDRELVAERLRQGKYVPAFQAAGPRERIFFDPGPSGPPS